MKKQTKKLTDAALLHQKEEKQLTSKQSKSGLTFSETDMLKLLHELEVLQIKLEMQNEELALAKEKAESAEEKYTELYDFAPSGYFTLSREGKILEMNLRSAQMMGKERSSLINSQLEFCIKEDSRIVFANFLEEIFQGKNKANCDVSFNCTHNNDYFVHLTGIVSEKKEQCFITATDITERKKAEEELKKNLAKYEVLINTFPIGITLSDKEGNIIETNEKALELLGLQREEHLKRKLKGEEWKIIKCDGTEFPQDEYPSVKALKENRLVENVEMGIVKSTEDITWLNVTAAPIPVEDFGVVIAYNDISERKLLEEKIRRNQEKYKALIDVSLTGIWTTDKFGNNTYVSPRWSMITGISPEEAKGTGWSKGLHPDDRELIMNDWKRTRTENKPKTYDFRFIRPDGSIVWVLSQATVVKDNDGNIIEWIGTVTDITKLKHAEFELIKAKEKAEESETKFRTLSENSPAIIYRILLKPSMKFVYVSPAVTEITGYTPEDHYADPELGFKMVHPDDRIILENSTHKTQGEPVILRWVKKDGKIIWTEQRNVLIFDTAGNPVAIEGIATDITVQKEAEEALRMNEELLDASQRLSKTGGWDWNVETQTMYWTEETYRIHDISPGEIEPGSAKHIKLSTECYSPQDRPVILAAFQRCQEEGQPYDLEFPFTSVKGRQLWIRTIAEPVIENGKTIRIIGNIIDVTAHKLDEEALRKSEHKVDVAREAILDSFLIFEAERDEQGNISDFIFTYINGNAENMLQLTSRQLIGKRMCEELPINRTNGFFEKYRNVVETGIPLEEEFYLPETHVPAAWYYHQVVKCDDGIAISHRDITERKQAEEEIIRTGLHYQALIEKAPDGIALISADAKFKYVSPAGKKMFGYNLSDEITVNPNEFTHPDDLPMVLTELGKTLADPGYVPTLEYRFKDKTGHWHWLETTFSNLLADPSVESIVLNFRDITERKLMTDTQTFLLKISNPGSDENFFESLAKYLSQSLDMEYVCIDLLEGDGLTAKTLAIYNEGNFDPNVSYALKDTPCGKVVGNHICCYPQEVCSLFPNDAALKDIKAESYIGTTLWSFDGNPIGLIAVIGQKPLQNQELAASILKLVSLRAAGKLEAAQAVAKLRESEEKFRVLAESSTVAIYLTDLNGKCTYVNPKWCEMAQVSYKDAIGDSWVNGIYEDDRKMVFENWQKMIASDGNWDCEYRFGTPDKISWVYGTAKSFKNDSGQIAGFIGSNVDITERKLAEEIINQEKLFNEMLIESLPGIFYMFDSNFTPLKWNRNKAEFLGLTNEEMKTHNTLDYIAPRDKQKLIETFQKTLSEGASNEVIHIINHEGNEFAYHLTGKRLDTPNGPLLIGVGIDVTERIKAENELVKALLKAEESETKYKEMTELLPQIVFETDTDGKLTYVNKYAYKMTGYSEEDSIIGKSTLDFYIPEDRRRAVKNIKMRLSGEKLLESNEYTMIRKDGSTLNILVYSNPIFKDSKTVGLRGIIVDISELKKTEQELMKAKHHAEESDHLKSAFLANMSHEIRTPMNGILGFSELLKEPGLTGKQQQEYIRIIEKSGARMLNIINDIIDISKIEAGLMNVNIMETDINEKIDFIYIFFKPQVEEKGMQILCKKPLPAKEAVIHTDNEKVYSILTNLVKNAIKFSKKGSIEIGYKRKGNDIEFYVKDTGIGIPKERMNAIFERFVQADISDKMARQGAGLGLAIAKAYVEMLGGKIWAESQEGIGSTFYFTLPYNTEPHKKDVLELNENYQNIPEVLGLKIVIAEDDEISEMLISFDIKEVSSKVIKVKTGLEAVEVCRNNPDIDLILMDIQMPDLNGYESTQQIRQFNKTVVIIAQTAFGLSGDREKAIKAGCNDYIAKPINKNKLLELIQKYFKK